MRLDFTLINGCARWSKVLLVTILILTFLPCEKMYAQQTAAAGTWDGWKFLIGEWYGEGSGQPGQGIGGYTFSLDLQGAILVRKNFAHYPATKDRPEYTHDDLMVVYYEHNKPEAIYFDNEKHIIRYNVEFSKDSTSVIFLSDVLPSSPRYRLTYTKAGENQVRITFETAPADKPEAFSRYIESVARRKQ